MLFTIERWDNSTISMMLLMTAIMLKANTAPNSFIMSLHTCNIDIFNQRQCSMKAPFTI